MRSTSMWAQPPIAIAASEVRRFSTPRQHQAALQPIDLFGFEAARGFN